MAKPRAKRSKKGLAPDVQETFINRIEECQNVLDHLDKCPAWDVISRDLERNKKFIDDNWQNVTDDKKLLEMKIVKLAYLQLLHMKDNYQIDLDNAQKELNKLQNPETIINKDYDNA